MGCSILDFRESFLFLIFWGQSTSRLSGRKIVDSVPPRKTLSEYPLKVFVHKSTRSLKILCKIYFWKNLLFFPRPLKIWWKKIIFERFCDFSCHDRIYPENRNFSSINLPGPEKFCAKFIFWKFSLKVFVHKSTRSLKFLCKTYFWKILWFFLA